MTRPPTVECGNSQFVTGREGDSHPARETKFVYLNSRTKLHCGIDTVRFFVANKSGVCPAIYKRNPLRRRITLGGGFLEWIPYVGFAFEFSVAQWANPSVDRLANAEDLKLAAKYVELQLNQVLGETHIIPQIDAWSITRHDIGCEFMNPNANQVIEIWAALNKRPIFLTLSECPTAMYQRKTYRLQLYDRSRRSGKVGNAGALLRFEAKIDRQGLRRRCYAYDQTVAGMATLIEEGIPNLLEKELKTLQIALEIQSVLNRLRADVAQEVDNPLILRLFDATLCDISVRGYEYVYERLLCEEWPNLAAELRSHRKLLSSINPLLPINNALD